jgi:hypothetical protein
MVSGMASAMMRAGKKTMNAIGFLVASMTTGGVSVAMIRGTSPRVMAGSNEYATLRNRRTIGWVFLITALLLLSIALLQLIIQD